MPRELVPVDVLVAGSMGCQPLTAAVRYPAAYFYLKA